MYTYSAGSPGTFGGLGTVVHLTPEEAAKQKAAQAETERLRAEGGWAAVIQAQLAQQPGTYQTAIRQNGGKGRSGTTRELARLRAIEAARVAAEQTPIVPGRRLQPSAGLLRSPVVIAAAVIAAALLLRRR